MSLLGVLIAGVLVGVKRAPRCEIWLNRRLELPRVAVDEVLVHDLVADDHREAVEVGFLGDGLDLAQLGFGLRNTQTGSQERDDGDGQHRPLQRRCLHFVSPCYVTT